MYFRSSYAHNCHFSCQWRITNNELWVGNVITRWISVATMMNVTKTNLLSKDCIGILAVVVIAKSLENDHTYEDDKRESSLEIANLRSSETLTYEASDLGSRHRPVRSNSNSVTLVARSEAAPLLTLWVPKNFGLRPTKLTRFLIFSRKTFFSVKY